MQLILINCMAKNSLLKLTYAPYTLPADFNEMDSFIMNNKILMTEHVVSSIEYAITKKLKIVEVFNFKESEYVVTVSEESFRLNLDKVYQFYIENEKYELCDRIKKIESKLNIISYTLNTNEKK